MSSIKATDITCPACNAAPGKFCKRRRSRGRSHRVRRDLAKAMSKMQTGVVLTYPAPNVRATEHHPMRVVKGDGHG